jgi:putative membrane protein
MALAAVIACGAVAVLVIVAGKLSSKKHALTSDTASQRAVDAPASTPDPAAEQPSHSPLPGARTEPVEAENTPAPPLPPPTDKKMASTPKGSKIGQRELQFLRGVMEQGRLQLYLGELARTKADTEEVKALGNVLASTQLEENKKVARLATLKRVSLRNSEPAGKKAVDARLRKLSGPKYDKTLLEEIIKVNQQIVAVYEAAAATRDNDIKAFVNEGLPLAKEKLLFANRMSGNARRSDKTPGFRAQGSLPPAQ